MSKNRGQIKQKNVRKKKKRKSTKTPRSEYLAAERRRMIAEKHKDNPPETLEDIPK